MRVECDVIHTGQKVIFYTVNFKICQISLIFAKENNFFLEPIRFRIVDFINKMLVSKVQVIQKYVFHAESNSHPSHKLWKIKGVRPLCDAVTVKVSLHSQEKLTNCP